MLDHALEWAAKGCAVFPLWWRYESGKCACSLPLCDNAGKHPRIQKGFHAATTDEDKIKLWWKQWPEANIGLATGKMSGLIVLDVDEEAGIRSIASIEKKIPNTFTVTTQSGGLHIYFKGPDQEVRSRIRFMPGLDLRGDGGYVVAPPSRGYAVVDDRDPVDFDWLNRLLRSSIFVKIAQSKGPLQLPNKITEGQRHDLLFKYACRLRGEGRSDESIRKKTHKLNKKRCLPPEERQIVDYLVDDVCERYAQSSDQETDRYDELGLVERVRLELATPEVDALSTREEHWFYDGGIWTPLCDDGVASFLHAWKDESFITADGKVKTFRPTRQRIMNVSGHLRLINSKPKFFDEKPNVLAFANEVVLPDGSTASHSPNHRLQFMRPEEHDPYASYEAWDAFLDMTFAGQDRDDKKAVLQEFAGAALFGAAPKYEKALILVGPGANGKSVIMKVMEGIMPPGSVTAVVPHDMHQEYRRATLANSLLNIVSEVPAKELRESESVKAIISGDIIEGRQIRKEEFHFRPCAAHLFAANTLPDITDFTLGFRRRWMILTCPNTVADENQIPDLGGKLLDSELQGIIRWAVDGMVRLTQNGGYTRCRSSEREVISWLRASDPVADFIEECCEIEKNGNAFVPKVDIYNKFTLWTSVTGRKRVAKRKFIPRFGSYVPSKKKSGTWGFQCKVDRIM